MKLVPTHFCKGNFGKGIDMDKLQECQIFSKKTKLVFSILFSIFLLNLFFISPTKAAIDELSIFEIGGASSKGCPNGLLVENNRAYLNSYCKGDLHVFDLSGQGSLAVADTVKYRDLEVDTNLAFLGFTETSLDVEGNKLFLGALGGIMVFDVTTPSNVTKDSFFSFPETPESSIGAALTDFDVQGNVLYALVGDAMHSIDVSDTSNLTLLDSLYSTRLNGVADFLENPSKIFAGVSHAFVQVNRYPNSNGVCLLDNAVQGGLAVYDIVSPSSLTELDFLEIPGLYDSYVDTQNNVAYVLETNSSTNVTSLVSYDVSGLSTITENARVDLTSLGLLASHAGSIDLHGTDLFVSFPLNHTIARFDVSTPSQIDLVDVISDDAIGGDATRLARVTRIASESNSLFAISPSENSLSEFTFTSSPTVIDPPRIVSISPSAGQTSVSTTGNIVITYDKNVTAGAGDIKIGRGYTILNDKAGVLDQVIAANSSDVLISGSTVTINPPEPFMPGTVVQVQIDDDAFLSAQDVNSFGKVFQDGGFQVTGDTTNPETCYLFPVPGTPAIDPCQKLIIDFEELSIVKGTSGNITIRRAADDSLVEDIPVTSSNVVVEGSTVTITPSTNLSIENSLYVTVEATAFSDAAGNFFAGITDNGWTFSGLGNNAPTVQAFTPIPGDTMANFNEGIELLFNKVVQKKTGNINIRNFSDDSLVEAIDVTTNQVQIPKGLIGSVVIFPSSSLPQGSQLYIEIDNGAFADSNNNNYPGISTNSWNFTGTYETEIPVDVNLSPPFVSYNVDLNSNLEITFSENVVAGSGSIFVRRASDDSLIETILASSGLVTISNNFVTINPSSDLSTENGVEFDIDAAAFVDADANNSVGIQDWTLFANDNESLLTPTLYTPASGSQLENLNTSYIITFSENIAKGTIGNFVFHRLVDNKILDTLSVTSDRVQISDNQVILLPQVDLSHELGIYITASAGAITNNGSTKTFTGISILDNHTWFVKARGQFDGQGGFNGNDPQILSFSPEPDSYNVNFTQTFSLEMSEAIAKGVGNILVRRYSNGDLLELLPISSSNVTVNGSTFQFTLTQGTSLNSESKVYIEIPGSAIVDLDGNEFSGIAPEEWVLSSGPDTEAPDVVALMPNIADQGVDLNKNLIIEFDEPIQKINGDILIKEFTTNQILQTIQVSSSRVSINENILSIDHTITVNNDATLYVQISNGSFEDLVGNNFAGFAERVWFFSGSTNNDQTGPNAISYDPKIGSSNNNFDDEFRIQFDEDIVLGQGFVLVRDSSDDSLIAQFDVQSIFVTAQGDTLVIDADTNFQGRNAIYVQVTENAVRDAAGNRFVGISDNSWNFRGSEQGDDSSGNGDNSTSNGMTITANDQTVTGRRKARITFSATRLSADRGTRCRTTFTGINKKRRRFKFKRGVSSRNVRFGIGKKQLRRLRREGASVTIGLNTTCRDGTSSTTTMNLTL
jgi:hypothetical protein